MADHPTRDDIDLLEGSFYVDDPHEKYTWMRANAPVYFDARERRVGHRVVRRRCSPLSKDPTTFSNAGGIRPDNGPIPMMIDMDDPEHWKRRKLVNKGFTPGRVRDSEPKIRDVVRRDHRRGVRARRVRLRPRHRRAAADDPDRRHARRRSPRTATTCCAGPTTW